MNTSELFFNTPVIDENGQVKNLSDFGGGGGALPIASAETLGGVKIGDGLSVTEDGTISVNNADKHSGSYVGTGQTHTIPLFEGARFIVLELPRNNASAIASMMLVGENGCFGYYGSGNSLSFIGEDKNKTTCAYIENGSLVVKGGPGYGNTSGTRYYWREL